MSERDIIAELREERDRAREECGHEKAMRAYLHDEMSRWITSTREERERADKAEAALARVEALADEGRAFRDPLGYIEAVETERLRAALRGDPA